LQGIRGKTGDYGHVGEPGPKVSGYIEQYLGWHCCTDPLMGQLVSHRVKRVSKEKRACEDFEARR